MIIHVYAENPCSLLLPAFKLTQLHQICLNIFWMVSSVLILTHDTSQCSYYYSIEDTFPTQHLSHSHENLFSLLHCYYNYCSLLSFIVHSVLNQMYRAIRFFKLLSFVMSSSNGYWVWFAIIVLS